MLRSIQESSNFCGTMYITEKLLSANFLNAAFYACQYSRGRPRSVLWQTIIKILKFRQNLRTLGESQPVSYVVTRSNKILKIAQPALRLIRTFHCIRRDAYYEVRKKFRLYVTTPATKVRVLDIYATLSKAVPYVFTRSWYKNGWTD